MNPSKISPTRVDVGRHLFSDTAKWLWKLHPFCSALLQGLCQSEHRSTISIKFSTWRTRPSDVPNGIMYVKPTHQPSVFGNCDFIRFDDEIHMKHLLDHYSIQLTRIYIVNIYLVCIWSIKIYFKYMYLSNVCLLKKLIYISKVLFPLHNHYNMNY